MLDISIHAPTWGATVVIRVRATRQRNFNPRTHVGCDSADYANAFDQKISIHAPTWGATEEAATSSR